MDTVVSLGVGSVGGAVASELLKVVIEEAKKVLAFKSVYKELASTMEEVLPVITEIEMLQGAEELKNLSDIINEALVVIRKCSEVKRWNLLAKAKYTRKTEEINKKMLKFCQIHLQLIIVRNQRLIMHQHGFRYCSSASSDMLDEKPFPEHTMEAINSHLRIINKKLDVLSVSPPVYRDLCSVPKIEKVLFGLDLPLMELKKKLLDDDSMASLVVSAPPGCGKTTLVTQLCHDDEIKEKFEHIFFSVLSSAPNFRTIVQNLLQHNGYEALAFENDSQAIVGLRNLFGELKKEGSILLVLDNVWHGSESLLQKFQINIPNFKILVTSRFEFPNFGHTYHLKPLGDEDASLILDQQVLLRHHDSVFVFPHDDSVFAANCEEILKRCHGFPLLIEVLGLSLVSEAMNLWELGQVQSWSEEETILDNSLPSVLECMQPSFNALESILKQCFLDMSSFLEDQKIRASAIIDIWVELHGKSSKNSTVFAKYLKDLALLNLLTLVPLGRYEQENSESFNLYNNPFKRINFGNEHDDGFYNEFLVTQHSILRELSICQSISEEHQERKRLNLEIREDKFPDWCLDLTQPINACLLSISTDDLFASSWVEMDCPNVEALVLNLSSSNYALPSFIPKMKKLKVVIIINHCLDLAKLINLSCLGSLPNLKRIRFEKISITLLDILQLRLGSLEKLSFFMCSFGEVFYDRVEIDVPYKLLPSLQEIDIDYCHDLDELLLYWVSEVVSLRRLSITNCNKLTKLPEAIGNLSKLEVMRLNSCFNLSQLPETMEKLGNLRFLDISHCLGLKKFPSEIGKLQKLKKISMRKCLECDLPDSVKNLDDLEVKCDEDTGLLWESLKPKMKNLSVLCDQKVFQVCFNYKL